MARKIKIVNLPDFSFGGNFGDQTPPTNATVSPYGGRHLKAGMAAMKPDLEVRRTLLPTSLENASLEAELGETVVTNLQQEGLPEFYRIGGKRHSQGGTPLNLPPNSFIFSRDPAMKLYGDAALAPFGKKGNKGYTPAELSLQYDINIYRQILADPDSDKLQRETAELMIKNYNMKLGALALAQESIKGFEEGIPMIAVPYMEHMGMTPDTFMGMGLEQTGSSVQQFRNGGEQKSKRRVLIKQLKQYQGGGSQPVTEKKGTSMPKGTKWDPKAKGYDKSQVQVGDYIKGDDGLWRKVTSFKAKKYEGPLYADERLGNYQESYSMLVEEFKRPEVQDAFWKQYQKELQEAKGRLQLSQAEIDEIKKKGKDEAIKDFLYLQKINLALDVDAKKRGVDRVTEGWDQDPTLANKKIKELGFETLVDDVTLGSFQIGYNGFVKMKDDPEDSKLIKNWMPAQIGVYNDERTGIDQYGIKPAKAVSKVDAWYGDTTAGQIVLPANVDQEMVLEDWKPDEEPAADEDLERFEEVPPGPRAKWWTQDLTNLGQALRDRFLIPEIRPWQATSEFTEATPTFTDFRGQAARLQALAANAANANVAFAGPQAQAALQTNLMRGMVDPMLQTQEREIATNVGIANQFELANTQARNAFEAQKAANATSLWDKQSAYEQQLANSKRLLEHEIVRAFNQGWTNKGQTQTMNTMTDQFKVDPVTGYTYFTGDRRKIKPKKSSNTTFSDNVAALKERFPEMDYRDIIALTKLDAGLTGETNFPPGGYGYNYPAGETEE